MPKKLITSALPYVNNQPHLGNIIGSVLSGDVYSRYCKKIGDDAVFICGTDEYGTATEMEAMRQGIHPSEIVLKNRKLHEEVYRWMNIEFDHFGHSSCKEHSEFVQSVFLNCYKNGFFEDKIVEQYFCEKCAQFLADRYVEGTCKHCGYHDARGDQCDACKRCLHTADLENPRCSICSDTPILKPYRHLFLRLDELQPHIKRAIDPKLDAWTANACNVYNEWIKKDIHSRCMTRNLKYKWGVPVPLAGYEDVVFYVWFDAPIGYYTFLSQIKKDWREWLADAKVVQFMGKDNVPFHSIIFPGILLAYNDKTTDGFKFPIVDAICCTEYLTFCKEKFSKSRKVGIFGMDLVTKDLGCSDFWRFYLIKRRPETKDADFSIDDFILQTRGELIANFGNFCNRTLMYIKKRMGCVFSVHELDSEDEKLVSDVNGLLKEYNELMEKGCLKDGLSKAFEISSCGNKYLQSLQTNKEKMASGYSLCCSLLRLLSHIMEPFVPEASQKLKKMLFSEDAMSIQELAVVSAGKISEDVDVLFKPFTDEQILALQAYNRQAETQ